MMSVPCTIAHILLTVLFTLFVEIVLSMPLKTLMAFHCWKAKESKRKWSLPLMLNLQLLKLLEQRRLCLDTRCQQSTAHCASSMEQITRRGSSCAGPVGQSSLRELLAWCCRPKNEHICGTGAWLIEYTPAFLWWKNGGDGQPQLSDGHAVYDGVVDNIPIHQEELIRSGVKALFVQRKDSVVLFQSSDCQNLDRRWIPIGVKHTRAVHMIEVVRWSN